MHHVRSLASSLTHRFWGTPQTTAHALPDTFEKKRDTEPTATEEHTVPVSDTTDIYYRLSAPAGRTVEEVRRNQSTPVLIILQGINSGLGMTPVEWVDASLEYGAVLQIENRGIGRSQYRGPSGAPPPLLFAKHAALSTYQHFTTEHPTLAACTGAALATLGAGVSYYAPWTALASAATMAGAGWVSRYIQPPFEIRDMAHDVIQVLKHAELENHPVVIIGVSMGSMIAEHVALDPEAPKKLKGLVLLFPGFGPMIGRHMPTPYALTKVTHACHKKDWESFLKTVCSPTQLKHLEHEKARLERVAITDPGNFNTRTLQAAAIMAAPDRRAQLRTHVEEKGLRVLALAGDHDPLIPHHNLTSLKKTTEHPHFEAEVLADVGHWITLNGPDAPVLLNKVRGFLTKALA